MKPPIENPVPSLAPLRVPAGAVRDELQRILTSGPFNQAPRLSRFLRFTIERTLDGQGEQLNQYPIGVEVFDRGAAYDPIADPIVRVGAARLRAKLERYYESEGVSDSILISYRRGSYTPTFQVRKTPAAGLDRGPQTPAKSLLYFDNVMLAGPNKALTYLGAAQYFFLRAVEGSMPQKQAIQQAFAAVRKVLVYDNTLADAHAMLGLIESVFYWHWRAAEREFKRALELNPNCLLGHQWYGQTCLRAMGRMDEAMLEIRRALKLDPSSPITNAILAGLLYMDGQYDLAIEQGRRTIELDPNCFWAYKDMGLSLARKLMFDESIAALEKADALTGGGSSTLGPLGYVRAVSGRKSEAQGILHQLEKRSKKTYVPPYHIAFIYAGLGDRDGVFEWLNKAYVNRCIWLVGIKVDPIFVSLRSDPRFTALLKKMGLQY